MDNEIKLSPTEFITVANQTLEYAYSSVLIEGEIASLEHKGRALTKEIEDLENEDN